MLSPACWSTKRPRSYNPGHAAPLNEIVSRSGRGSRDTAGLEIPAPARLQSLGLPQGHGRSRRGAVGCCDPRSPRGDADHRSAIRLGRGVHGNRSVQPRQGCALLPCAHRDLRGHAHRHRGARPRRAQRVPLGRLRRRRSAGFSARAAHRRLGMAADRRMKQVLIVGAGFAGLNAAKRLRNVPGVAVTLLDRENHHLFQPLLYQVAMAALSPADIAVPIRSLFAHVRNIRVLKAEVQRVNVEGRAVVTDCGEFKYDYLLLASGSQHAYFGHEEWERYAPGLKTLPQATEIRRRVLEAFEAAERDQNLEARRRHLTFVVVGGGPTGVELAGAIGEMSRYTLARDFRSIDPRQTRVILIEAGPRILPSFDDKLAARAMRDLESLGVQVWTNSRVTNVDEGGVNVGNEHVAASTVLWAAGVRAADVGRTLG